MNKLRKILPWLLSSLTGKPRYLPDIQWSSESWVHNIFRAYELVFWRKYGIRKEASVSQYKDKIVYEFYTLEATLAHLETLIRQFFDIKWLEVRVTQLQFAMPVNTAELQIPWISFAIAVDATSNVGGTSVTHTCTGSNLVIWGCANNLDGATDNVSAISYNSVGLTLIDKRTQVGNASCYLFELVAPATGAHTLALTASPAFGGFLMGVSYTGSDQNLTTNHTNNAGSAVTTLATSLTVLASDWTILVGGNSTSPLSAGTGSTTRVDNLASNAGTFDSNGALSAGSYSMSINSGGLALIVSIMAAFSPPASSQIKSVSGVAQASIKSISSTTNANIKSVSGVANS